MGLSKAFGAIKQTTLWTTLYKKGTPGEMIKHSRRGHRGSKLAPKYKGGYGELKENGIGISKGYDISALLFIIYMGDAMEDYAAMNRRSNFPTVIVQDRPHEQQ